MTNLKERWQAIVDKNAGFDGKFFYAVKTTGVYCRPSCPARLPLAKNVEIYNSEDEARAAGFRPCKRCKPDQAPLRERHAASVAKACRLIENADETLSLRELAEASGMSEYHFHRKFKEHTGLTPREYAAANRARRVQVELVSGTHSVSEVIYESGFNSSGRFYEASEGMLGMRPKEYKAGGKNAEIRFAVAQCSLGAILIAQSERGICAILLGDDPDELARDLQDRFPNAKIVGATDDFDKLVSTVIGFIESPSIGLYLPLDIRGTAFQRRVWQALQKIPVGKTASYSEIAQTIGEPKAVRAVAQACAQNSLAVAIPCHRVVRTDGSVSGYRWGVERKRKLLETEARRATASPGSQG